MGSRRYRLVLVAVAVAGLALSATVAAVPAGPSVGELFQKVDGSKGVVLDVACHLDSVDCSTGGNVSVDPCEREDEVGTSPVCEELDWTCLETSDDDGRDAHVCTPPWLSCPDEVESRDWCPKADVDVDAGPVGVNCTVTVGHVDCKGDVGDEDGSHQGPSPAAPRSPSEPVAASTTNGVRTSTLPGASDGLQAGSSTPAGQGVPIGGPVDGDVWTATAAAVAVGAGLVVLYRRLTRDDVLDNDLRQRILDEVASSPGIHARELARRLDVSPNTVIYHARILVEHDLLATREAGRRVAYFRPGDDDRPTQVVQAALSSDAKRRVAETVVDRPASTISEVAERLDLHRSTVKHHVDALVEAGVLESDDEGRCRELTVSERLRDAVRELA